ncbi:response regulator [Romboutsia sp. 1001713B170207_170306_H8]|uniref:response regulator n=1 Tax=Romboutsia sp. 1001713B170207_170306_H8 TaxID=2787112 RepID=UPI0008217DBB|nr:HD domain-containing phosphohydrolase [Romboutsia sp. 1001713B170207_170306_H8]SCG94488.1 Cyclic di-GMP phosphodiesterase response regulator RpfG [uncultured Clostridium sp.]
MKLKHILVIDDNVTNLKFAEKTLKPYYKVSLLISGAQTLKFLSKNKPDLILLDINMPDMDGYETIKNIKANQDLENVPVIFLSAITDSESEVRGIELGAVDFINKPFVPQSMLSRVKMHLELSEYKKELESKVSEKTEMIEHLQDVMMLSLEELVECRDENTGGHVKRTAEYVRLLTEEIVDADLYSDILTPEYIKDIVRSAPLHDIGKIGINDSTLLKTTSLDNDEFEYMKKHVELGSQSLQKMINETGDESFLYIAKDMAHYHHEKWDGTGYPEGLKGEDIPISARIMAIADVYDALTTKRPYKEPFSHEMAVNLIIDGKGKGFDPKIVDVFEKIHYKFELVNF